LVLPLAILLTLLELLLFAPEGHAQATCTVSATDQAIDAEEHQLLELVNDYRGDNGLPALFLQPDVTRAAAWFSRDMATKNYFPGNHIDSNNRDIPTRMAWCGAVFNSWAENIYAGSDQAEDVFNAWRLSDIHNTNMLRSNVSAGGIARAFQAGSMYGWYWTMDYSDSRPVPIANFDNDEDSDVSVYRASSSTWFVQGGATVSFGTAGDIPVPGDYDGDGDHDIAVYRPSNGGWFIQGQPTVFLGQSSDIPVPADYDGDGDTDPAVFRPSVGGWFINGQATVFFGLNGDLPVPANYDGEGGDDIAVFRPAVGGWYRVGVSPVFWGFNGDIPVPANYDGDLDDDIAIFRPAVGGWYIKDQSTVFFGLSGDFPVPGQLDGDAADDVAVFRRQVGGWYISGGATTFFGIPGDVPLVLPHHIQRFFTFAGA
jgi:uncharacterized protein YkwD